MHFLKNQRKNKPKLISKIMKINNNRDRESVIYTLLEYWNIDNSKISKIIYIKNHKINDKDKFKICIK